MAFVQTVAGNTAAITGSLGTHMIVNMYDDHWIMHLDWVSEE